jgi:hypothetical protein
MGKVRKLLVGYLAKSAVAALLKKQRYKIIPFFMY